MGEVKFMTIVDTKIIVIIEIIIFNVTERPVGQQLEGDGIYSCLNFTLLQRQYFVRSQYKC